MGWLSRIASAVVASLALALVVATAQAGAVKLTAVGGNSRPVDLTVAAACSKAAAVDALPAAGFPAGFAEPIVFQVLCGAFAGPGSQVMVATYYGPGNTGLVAWAAYRLVNGSWQPVVSGRMGVKLSVVGADFKTTQSIFRPGDPRCCPSGGTRSRIWHWNGSTFVPSAWVYSKTVIRFYTPSRNIRCEMSDNGSSQSSVFCGMEKPPAIVGVLANGHVTIQRGGSGNWGEGPPARLLSYGSSATVGRFRCRSAFTGVTCVVTATGEGFFLSKRSVRRVG